jgi:hypothetical protein
VSVGASVGDHPEILITGLEPDDGEDDEIRRVWKAGAMYATRQAILWLQAVECEEWFQALPSTSRRFCLSRLRISRIQPGKDPRENAASLHVHFPRVDTGLAVSGAAAAIAIAQLMRGYHFGEMNVAAFGEPWVSGKLPPPILGGRPIQLFGPERDVNVPTIDMLLCADTSKCGNYSIPQKYNEGLDVKAFTHMKDMIEYAFKAAST